MSQLVRQVAMPLDKGRIYAVLQSEGEDSFFVMDCSDGMTVAEVSDLNLSNLYLDALALEHSIRRIQDALTEDDQALLAVGVELTRNEDDASVLSDEQVLNQLSFNIDELNNSGNHPEIARNIDHELRKLEQIYLLSSKPSSILVAVPGSVNDDDEYDNQFVFAAFEYDSDGYIAKIDIHVLRSDYVFLKDSVPMSQLLLDVLNSPVHEAYIETDEERDSWAPVIEKMPHFSQASTSAERIYVFEGGPVLEHLQMHRPWLVEKGADGLPVPLRVVQVKDDMEFGMNGMQFEAAKQAGNFMQDHLHAEAALKRQIAPRIAVKQVVNTTLAAWGVNASCALNSGSGGSSMSPSM